MKTYYEQNLPHILPIGATFFVTYCLNGALPKIVLHKLQEEYNQNIHKIFLLKDSKQEELIYNEQKRHFKRFDEALHYFANRDFYLKDPKIAKLVAESLIKYNNQFYQLLAYCIMPNHVHALFDFSIQLDRISSLKEYTQLYDVMRLIKGSTSRCANQLLDKQGHFWQKESYDHYVRNPKELNNIINYIRENPVKAGIVTNWYEWEFTYVK